MSATNGSLRSRSRLIGLSLGVIIALTAVFASAASAEFKAEHTTMALGDSLAFGYSQQTFNENLPTAEPATAFENGYANQYLNQQQWKGRHIRLENLGCPGETSDSLIGNGALAGGLKFGEAAKEKAREEKETEEGKTPKKFEPEAYGEAPCAYHETAAEAAGFPAGTHFPLHTEYGGAGTSQLEAALHGLVVNKLSGTPVNTITFNIGANDELHQIKSCEKEVKEEITPEEGAVDGAEAHAEGKEAGEDGAEAKAAFEKGENTLGSELKAEAEEDGASAQATGKEAESDPFSKYNVSGSEGNTKSIEGATEGGEAQGDGAEAHAEGKEAEEDGAEAKTAFEKGENALGAELKAEAEEDGASAAATGKEAEEDGAVAKADFEKAGEEAVKSCIEFHFEGLVHHILSNVGRALYVLRNAETFTKYPGTNYTGKIIIQGGYDPYGRVYKTEAEVAAAKAVGPQFSGAHLHELLKGTNGLTAIINGHEKELVEFGPESSPGEFHACFAGVQGGAPGHPHTAFNPGIGHEEGELGSLQKYTNMNNQSSAVLGSPFGTRPNGPDIHPTAEGAHQLALVMNYDCGV